MKTDFIIPTRGISLLVKLRQTCLADDALALEATGCGRYAAANIIDDLIANILKMETGFYGIRDLANAANEENAAYRELLEGWTPEMLNEKETAKLKALVKEWEEAAADE